MRKNKYKQFYEAYIDRGYTVVPGKYGSKSYGLKGLNKHLKEKITLEEAKSYAENEKLVEQGSNIDLMLGEVSGVIALDLDTDSPETLAKIEDLLPSSPVEKRGSKGWTRFFRYMGEFSESLTDEYGNVIIEVLSTNKKTTIPPSLHPNGASYVWTTDKELLDFDPEELPVFPPFLVSELGRILNGGRAARKYGSINQGRNSELSKFLGTLLNEEYTVDAALTKLIEHDKETNSPPYFTDPSEHYTTDAITNALSFYSSHLTSINSKRLRENKEYLTPIMDAVNNIEEIKESARKKSLAVGQQKKLKDIDYSLVPTAIKTLAQTLNKNSWVPQPNLAIGASIALISALSSRKFQFEGSSPNVYIGAISKSGSGKNSGMEFIKNTLIDMRAERLLGSADIPSEAGLMDALTLKPQLILPLDEIGGILKSAISGKSDYNSKLGDLLCELYTTSTGRFLGRALTEGTKGATDRPNLTIYGATTPRGFQDSIDRSAIQKGLLGRFLLFFGDPRTPSRRVSKIKKLPTDLTNQLLFLASFVPPETDYVIQDRPQRFQEIKIEDEASNRLTELFEYFDKVRLDNMDDNVGPIAARLYQQMIKIVMISAIASSNRNIPTITLEDVEFGKHIIEVFFHNFKLSISDFLFDSFHEKRRWDVYKIIRDKGLIDKPTLFKETASLSSNVRESILKDLMESDMIETIVDKIEGKATIYYKEK